MKVRAVGGRDFRDVAALTHDCLRNEKAGGEFFIMSGCAHGGRKSFPADANFERFLDCEIVMMILK